MSSREKLLTEIEGFLTRNAMSASRFGVSILNDTKFVSRLRDGKDVRLETADRVRKFMRDFEGNAPRRQAPSRSVAA